MKQDLVFDIVKKIKTRPDIVRKLKIFALVGIAIFLFTGAITIWAGVTAVNYVATKATEASRSPIAQHHVENLKSELEKLPELKALNCWDQAQEMLAIRPWLERSIAANIVILQTACFKEKSALSTYPDGTTI